jgi:hypothetical protein
MKRLNSVVDAPRHILIHRYKISLQIAGLFLLLFSGFSLTGCKQDADKKDEIESLYPASGLPKQTLHELQQVREATARYHDIGNAFTDNYVDINLKLANMGYHFLKAEQVTPVFDLRKPPILVYNKKPNGDFELLAVEYAVPIDSASLHTPPNGFTGNADEWDFNTLNTGWWTLHAWVWDFNPDGVFKPMNPAVIVN